MDELKSGIGGLQLSDDSISDLLDSDPSSDSLHKLLDRSQGLSFGPAHNGEGVASNSHASTALGVRRGLQAMRAGDWLEALHYLSECHSTTLRHYMIMKSSCRLAQLQCKLGRPMEDSWPAGTQEALLDIRRRLLQYKPSPLRREEMLALIDQVPPDWTVVQLTAVPRVRTHQSRLSTPELVVARFRGGDADSLLLSHVPAPPADHCCTFRSEFDAMLADNASIQRSLSHDRQQYWTQRGLLDDRMKAIVRSMEVAWLGRQAYLVSGDVVCDKQRGAIEAAVSAVAAPLSPQQRARLALLCSRPPSCDAELAAAIGDALGAHWPHLAAVVRTLTARRQLLRMAALSSPRRGQVMLVLDREVQHYPWEMVGPLVLGPVCRLPSLAILGLSLAGRRVQAETAPAAAASGATYILNPAGDLANTEQRMGPFLAERGWRGIVGRPPTLKEFAAALTDGQILAYCGHGSGSQYLPAEKLRSLTCKAVALLFGCSSGQLLQPGPTVDPHGSVYAYLMANCPAILGNLWSVTDNMLDTYSKAVIEKWTGGDGSGLLSLPEAVSAARGSVSSAFMAAAPVVYGLPVTPDAMPKGVHVFTPSGVAAAPVVYGLPVTPDAVPKGVHVFTPSGGVSNGTGPDVPAEVLSEAEQAATQLEEMSDQGEPDAEQSQQELPLAAIQDRTQSSRLDGLRPNKLPQATVAGTNKPARAPAAKSSRQGKENRYDQTGRSETARPGGAMPARARSSRQSSRKT